MRQKITNDEYRQVLYFWVKDSIVRQKLSEQYEEFLLKNKEGEPYDPPRLNWRMKIDPKNDEYKEAV